MEEDQNDDGDDDDVDVDDDDDADDDGDDDDALFCPPGCDPHAPTRRHPDAAVSCVAAPSITPRPRFHRHCGLERRWQGPPAPPAPPE
eukprot:7136959-Pyramimonas_sp.AAC.1